MVRLKFDMTMRRRIGMALLFILGFAATKTGKDFLNGFLSFEIVSVPIGTILGIGGIIWGIMMIRRMV